MAHDILIVDDEADIRLLIAQILKDEGYEAREAVNSTEALNAIRARRPSLVVLDIWLQGSELDGLAVLDVIRDNHPSVPVVMISGHGTIETAVSAIKRGAYDFVEKPFKTDRLLLMIERAIEAARLRRENEELRVRAGVEAELVGQSAIINQLRQSIEKVAPTGSRVLIAGPAGSGKEVVARIIHAGSRRAAGPFIVLNCATMRPENLEVELLGQEIPGGKGTVAKVGTLEQAHNGTMLLDEVADMPLETQGKIVRALQEQTFERVGGNTRVKVDVRVIAATNRNLLAEVSAGRFREDLYYRLHVFPITVPPLRDRDADVELLARLFIDRCCSRIGRPSLEMTPDCLRRLRAYHWPGNVRELENIITRASVLTTTGRVTADELSRWLAAGSPGFPLPAPSSLPLGVSLEEMERRLIEATLDRFGGHRARTAKALGIGIRTLSGKLRQYGYAPREKSFATETRMR
jgi:two-component system, NtrC family, nitrogen regulation response regulator NtrX